MNKKPIISMVAAMDEQRGIGYKNMIPWKIREDLVRFRDLTVGKTVIFGRKTYESLLGYYQRSGKAMPKRKTVVVSRSAHQKEGETYFVSSFEDALKLARKIEAEEVFVSGGAQIFNLGIDYAQKLYLTVVKGKYRADTFFPDYSKFKIVKKEDRSNEKYSYSFLEMVRKQASKEFPIEK